MPQTLIGVVYDPVTATVHRIIFPDDDSQLTSANYCSSSEAFLTTARIVDLAEITEDDINAIVSAVVFPSS